MYHCHIQFYFIGKPCRIFELIKEMPPLEHFTHGFLESEEPEGALMAKADVILAGLQDRDGKEALRAIVQGKKREAELIVLADKAGMTFLSDDLSEIKDIWICPMSDEEIRFRFLRWQQTCKMGRDFWETSQYFETTINHVPNLVWYKDKNGIHEKVNDSFCKSVNKTKAQVEGRSHAYIWDVESDDPACIESEHEVMSKRQTFVSEEIITTGEGMRTLTTYKSPLYDWDGSVMGTVGVAIDVTQERAYEQEIIKKNRTLETIFTTLDCGVIRHTVDGMRVLHVNRAALKLLGYGSQEEMVADGFDLIAESVLDEDKERLRESIRTLDKEGDSVSVEYRVRHKDGEILHVMGNVRLLEENGELLYQRFLLDCTEQKLQEKRNERRQMELIQALSIDYNIVCFFELDTGMGFPLRNEETIGDGLASASDGKLSYEECIELYIQKVVYEDDKEMLREWSSLEHLKEELAGKKQLHVNYRTCRDGEIAYFQMKVVRAGIWDESHGIVLGFRSVDEEIRNELEQKNLLEDALLQANRASKAKSVFLSNMSHDIRTPMNAIVGFTSLAIARKDNKEQVEEYLNKIMTSGNHLLSLINDVLDMSRIESGKMQLEEESCSLPDILQGLRNILQADARAKQLKLQIDAADVQNEEIYCDKLRLNQVLLNLLSNAVKYTEEGGTVSMQVTEKADAPDGLAIYEFLIQDTGIGMSEEFVKHIFEPFERERCSTTSGIQGTGLGMAITKNIVDMMNGTIEVKSEQGVGTEVRVSFTFRLDTEGKQPQDIPKSGEELPKRHGGRILLTEDNELNREIATAILEDAGFTIETAENGQIAVDMLKKSEPGYYRLVLMDVRMPVMNGYEATKAIRKLENKELASIPILAMTANAFEEDRQEALQAGMSGHLAKPIDVEALFEALDKVLN